MRWELTPTDPAAAETLRQELEIPATLARVMAGRGFAEPERAYQFLHPSLDQLHDPFRMAGMPEAVERLRRAIHGREKILIYGDYDVDGTMAAVALLTALTSLGAVVETFIPHRTEDGYGMQIPAIERAAAQGFRVIVSVDTGIREHPALVRARELGLDCIVTDHHLPKETLPAACAILNPHRSDCRYPDKNLSGVGVAFKLVQAMMGPEMSEPLLKSYLKIISIGTIADVVPLIGENRIFARFGLEGLGRPRQPGLEALIKVAGLEGSPITAGDVGFRIAPRLNAAGRMEDARSVIELFSATDAKHAESIALRLDALNRERQRIEDHILAAALDQAAEDSEIPRRRSLVFAGEGWHPGVIGIVAQRLAERFYRPTLVVGMADGTGRGSGRSIPGFNLDQALADSSNLFERFGGHAQAGGFTLRSEHVPELRRRFEAYAQRVLRPEDLEPRLRIDAEVAPHDVDWPLLNALDRLEPCGPGNPTPVLLARGFTIAAPPLVLHEKHLKLKVRGGGRIYDALAWNKRAWMNSLSAGQWLDAAFTLEENHYQGFRSLQLILKDVRPAAAA